MKYLLVLLLICFSFSSKSQVKLLTLSELEQRVAKGKDTTYVINFWATWCGPCVAELPNFEKLNLLKSAKPLKIILVSLDFKSKLQTAVVPFVKKNKIKSSVYVINEPDQQAFIEKVDMKWSGAIPATLFINTKKNIRLFYEKEFTFNELNKVLETEIK
jgi:thiol-disulfide isomerase/thioredoxin